MPINVSRRKSQKLFYAKMEVSESAMIPYQYHWDKETLITKHGEFLQIVKVDGFSFETADDEDVDMRKMVRNSLFKSMADGNYAVWFHLMRSRQSVYPGGKHLPGFAAEVDKQWRDKHVGKDSFVNELYITVLRKSDTKGASAIHHYLKKASELGNKPLQDQSLRDAHKELAEVVSRVAATFKDYGARTLTVVERDGMFYSEPMELLGRLVNCGYAQPMLVTDMDISHYAPAYRLYFGGRAVEACGHQQKRYAGLVAIREYAPATAAGLLDGFLQLPFEFIISQSYVFHNRQINISKMQTRQRRMMAAEDKAISQVAEISDALDMAMSGHVAFGDHQLTVMCYHEDQNELEKHLSLTIAELVNVGINPAREKFMLEQAYWAQLPGNFDFVARGSTISTMNLAGFASLHNYPTGKVNRKAATHRGGNQLGQRLRERAGCQHAGERNRRYADQQLGPETIVESFFAAGFACLRCVSLGHGPSPWCDVRQIIRFFCLPVYFFRESNTLGLRRIHEKLFIIRPPARHRPTCTMAPENGPNHSAHQPDYGDMYEQDTYHPCYGAGVLVRCAGRLCAEYRSGNRQAGCPQGPESAET